MLECASMITPYDHTSTSGMRNHANLFLSLDIIFDTSEAVGGHLNEVIVEKTFPCINVKGHNENTHYGEFM